MTEIINISTYKEQIDTLKNKITQKFDFIINQIKKL